jgi:tetrapyrrole methylase family protein/MazG family protein
MCGPPMPCRAARGFSMRNVRRVHPEQYTFTELVQIMSRLRSHDGCPWDRQQTIETLRAFLLEETYELLEAIDRKNPADHCEELGDVLFQIVFQAQIAAESGSFTIGDVIDRIARKLISRHPHVFGSTTVKDAGEVATVWQQIKKAEKAEKGLPEAKSLLDGVPRSLPALLMTHRLSERAGTIGFDWKHAGHVLEKVREEYQELEHELAAAQGANNQEGIAWELGDLLFTLANLARHLDLSGEDLLRQANQRFRERFRKVEELAISRTIDITAASQDTLEALWNDAKQLVRS